MIWPAIIGAAVGLYSANQQKKSNQASINAMQDIANRPQQTALGSFFNPGGMSGLAPFIQGGRTGVLGQLPGYRSQLTSATNSYLGSLGKEYQTLTGQSSNPFLNMMSFNPSSYGAPSGPRPAVMAAPNQGDFFQYTQPKLKYQMSGWGHVGKPTIEMGGRAFDQDAFSQAMNQYQMQQQQAGQWDQQNAMAQQQAEAARAAAEQQFSGPATGGLQQSALEAALNPLREKSAQEFARQQRDMGRRGIAGSSLANNQLANTQSIFGRQLTDATAQVQQQQLAQRLGINEAALNASTSLINNLSNINSQELGVLTQMADEELRQLGLQGQNVSALMQPLGLAMQNNNQYWDQMGRLAMGVGGSLSGNPFAGGSTNPYKNQSDAFGGQ